MCWGATIEAVVREEDADAVATSHFRDVNRIGYSTAFELPPRGLWNGILLATVDDDEIYDIVKDLITRWQPLVAILAIPSNIAYVRRQRWAKGLGCVRK